MLLVEMEILPEVEVEEVKDPEEHLWQEALEQVDRFALLIPLQLHLQMLDLTNLHAEP